MCLFLFIIVICYFHSLKEFIVSDSEEIEISDEETSGPPPSTGRFSPIPSYTALTSSSSPVSPGLCFSPGAYIHTYIHNYNSINYPNN